MCFFLQLVSTQLVLVNTSFVPRPPPFFVLQFSFSIIHRSGYYTERKLKNKRGRPGNKARSTHSTHADACACVYTHTHTHTHTHTCTKAGMSDTVGMTLALPVFDGKKWHHLTFNLYAYLWGSLYWCFILASSGHLNYDKAFYRHFWGIERSEWQYMS